MQQESEKTKGLKPMHKCVRCQFVTDFMASQGLTFTSAGKLIGITHSSLHHDIADVDDMKLSQIFKLFEGCGYCVKMQLVRLGDDHMEEIADDDNFVIGTDGKVKLKRTSFISFALKRYKIGKYELCEKLLQPRIQYSSFRRMLDLDDMYLSRIFSIAEAIGANLVVNISQIVPAEVKEMADGKPLCIVRYTSEKTQVIE